MRPTDGMPAARAAAQRAIDLAPSMPNAHAVSALVAGLYEHDWAEAALGFGRALHGNPDPWARFAYATWYLSPLGRHHEALTEVRRASVDDPLNLLGRVQVAMELCSIGHVHEGVHELELILAIDPRFGPALGLLGRECILRGRVDDAMTLAQRAYAATPQHPNGVGFFDSRDNVLLVQGREHCRFALKRREPIVVSSERGQQDLDRDLPFQLRVARAKHLPIPPPHLGRAPRSGCRV